MWVNYLTFVQKISECRRARLRTLRRELARAPWFGLLPARAAPHQWWRRRPSSPELRLAAGPRPESAATFPAAAAESLALRWKPEWALVACSTQTRRARSAQPLLP